MLSVSAVGVIVTAVTIGRGLLDFVFFYPLFMSFIWTAGAVYYFFGIETKGKSNEQIDRELAAAADD